MNRSNKKKSVSKNYSKSNIFWVKFGVIVAIIGVLIAILGIISNYQRNKTENSKRNIFSKLKIIFLINNLQVIDHDQNSIEYQISGFNSNGLPIDDVKLELSVKNSLSKDFNQDESALSDLGITTYKVSPFFTLSIANPNYQGKIKIKPTIPGKFILKVIASSDILNISESTTCEITVIPRSFFFNNSSIDVKPFNLFSLSEYQVYFATEEFYKINKDDYYWDPFLLKIYPDYLGYLGGSYLKIESFPNDVAYLTDKTSSFIAWGCKLWKIEISNEHQIRLSQININKNVKILKSILYMTSYIIAHYTHF